jgi:hypothetical protein
MSGIPKFNIPLFDELADLLRVRGFKVVSPAELDDKKIRDACLASPDGKPTPATHGGGTWADFLTRDVKLISDQVGGIVFLPDWWRSRGARLEAFVGLLTDKQFARWQPYMTTPEPVSKAYVQGVLREYMP